jgi:crotonobetainyl-CoA:carnitine CoA-transferase CaiB-like acyl-CoA transferase
LSGAQVKVSDFAAGLSEHGREVLSLVGYTDNEIDRMAAEGVVWLG